MLKPLKKFLLLLCSAMVPIMAFGQGSWSSLPDHPGPKHRNVASFQIGDKVYYLMAKDSTGCSYKFWEFDASSQSWTQLSDFPGNNTQKDLDGFAIDSTGYIGTGASCGGGTLAEFWAYDPRTDTWTQKASYPAGGREMTIAFSVNGKGFIGLGRSSFGNNKTELYSYDPNTDSWTQRAFYPGEGKINDVALTAYGNAYVQGGASSTSDGTKELWQYDPQTDQWGQLPDLPGQGRANASGFEISGYLYFGGGWNGTSYFSDFYRYDPLNNVWKSIPDKPGTALRNAEGFSVDGKGYFVGGKDASNTLTDAVHVYRSAFVSQKEFQSDKATFSLYPNPAQEKVRIEMKGQEKAVQEVRLLSTEGKLLLSEEMNGPRKELGLNGLAKGLYFIELRSEDGSVQRKKLMVK
ncbi:MAG: kelch repeat-containing protein [Flavobacteriales bacterium]